MRRPILLATALVLAACRGGTPMPEAWGPLALGKGERCPSVAGHYVITSGPIATMLASRLVKWDSVKRQLASFELAGSTDVGLEVTAHYTDGTSATGQARKGDAQYGDYYCADGWMRFGDAVMPYTMDSLVTRNGDGPRRRAMRVAPGRDGALVARLDGTTWKQFDVWCGDGCKGFPIPGTFKTVSAWSRAVPWDPKQPPDAVVAQEGRREELRRAEAAGVTDDPVWKAEQALENPTTPGEPGIRQRALDALPAGVMLRGVGPHDAGWHLSVEFDDDAQLASFMTRLSQNGPTAEVRVAPLYRGKLPDGRWADVVYLRTGDASR